MLPKKKLIVLIIPFLLFIGSLTAQLILRSHITSKIEPVTFPSTLDDSNPLNPIVEITSGDLFYPRDYNPANTYPIVIIVHGFQVTKTTDLRLATELAKRNIFALPIDLSGHGHTSGRLGPYFWKHAIGALDYIYSRPDLFNLSAVGMCGHSLGGWTTFLAMGYEAGRLNRINASVTWAGIFNTTRLLVEEDLSSVFSSVLANMKVDLNLFENMSYLFDHNPVSYYNGSLGAQPAPDAYGPRMLIIQGLQDDLISPGQIDDANKTLGGNATFYILPQGDHLLIDDSVVYETILHFELHFFGTSREDSTLSISDFTYWQYYILDIVTLLGLFLSILSLCFIFWYFSIFKRIETPSPVPHGFKFTFFASIPYIGLIFAIYGIQQVLFNLYLALLIGSSFFMVYTFGLLIYLNRKSLNKTKIWEAFRSNFYGGGLLVGFHLGLFAILSYLALANGFGLLLFSPLNIEYLIFALLGLYPFIFSHELFLRKIIQDNIPLKNRWLIRIFMGFITLGIMVIFIWLLNVVFLAMIAMLVGFAAATFSAIFIYAKYPSLSATTVFITIITGTLAANCYFFFI
ncbi:MAG: serine aminopeptidase domain-containing protein [Candidatus Helarchaeota archaeon]